MRTVLVVFMATGLGYMFLRKMHVIRSAYQPSPAQVQELRALAGHALRSGDVPVAALLLHGDTIIGRGYNTVLRDTAAGGHAEVNALTDAFRHLGRERFAQLDRGQLLLVSTFEPCAMCRGLMLEYRIDRMAFVEPKSLGHWLREDVRAVGIEWRKRGSAPGHLQDSLFRTHPAYDAASADH
jgi:tRNA(Arg) A34 adenosine deaminase TadA